MSSRQPRRAFNPTRNIVGSNALVRFPKVDIDEWNKLFEINVTGTLRGIQTCAPLIRESGGGSIVNIGSVLLRFLTVAGIRPPAYGWKTASSGPSYCLSGGLVTGRSGVADRIARLPLRLCSAATKEIYGGYEAVSLKFSRHRFIVAP
jgi:NAD(P)-dependent dehydrogenase (short-subunit alcohol dehydrogenase family)